MHTDSFWHFTGWEAYKDIVHGVSTKAFGDCVDAPNQKKFFSDLGLSWEYAVSAEQIHKNALHIVSSSDRGKCIPGVDALLLQKSPSTQDMSLMIRIADCTPLFFYDPKTNTIGLAHAGWKGIVGHIEKEVLLRMIEMGSKMSDIHIAIGPHIGPCCYHVEADRAHIFSQEFGEDVMVKKDTTVYVDFDACLTREALDVGMSEKNIVRADVCTYHAKDMFFSCRRNPKDFGEMISVLGFTTV